MALSACGQKPTESTVTAPKHPEKLNLRINVLPAGAIADRVTRLLEQDASEAGFSISTDEQHWHAQLTVDLLLSELEDFIVFHPRVRVSWRLLLFQGSPFKTGPLTDEYGARIRETKGSVKDIEALCRVIVAEARTMVLDPYRKAIHLTPLPDFK